MNRCCMLQAPGASVGVSRLPVGVPAAARRPSRATRQPCRAQEQQQQPPEASAPASTPPPTPTPAPQAAGSPPPERKVDDRFDYNDAPDALGPVGNFFMAALLAFLCFAAFFTTVGRQFQADLVPLDDTEYEQMMAASKTR